MNQRLSVLVVEVQHDALYCIDSTSNGTPLVSTTLLLYMDSTGGLIMTFRPDYIAAGLLIALISIILVIFGGLVVDTAYHHYQDSHAKEQVIEGWEPPVIPSCNKELWDRIREGCD